MCSNSHPVDVAECETGPMQSLVQTQPIHLVRLCETNEPVTGNASTNTRLVTAWRSQIYYTCSEIPVVIVDVAIDWSKYTHANRMLIGAVTRVCEVCHMPDFHLARHTRSLNATTTQRATHNIAYCVRNRNVHAIIRQQRRRRYRVYFYTRRTLDVGVGARTRSFHSLRSRNCKPFSVVPKETRLCELGFICATQPTPARAVLFVLHNLWSARSRVVMRRLAALTIY